MTLKCALIRNDFDLFNNERWMIIKSAKIRNNIKLFNVLNNEKIISVVKGFQLLFNFKQDAHNMDCNLLKMFFEDR